MLSFAGTRPSVTGEGGAKEALVAAIKKIIIDKADVAATLADAQATANAALSD